MVRGFFWQVGQSKRQLARCGVAIRRTEDKIENRKGADGVKIEIQIDPQLHETEILVRCGQLTAETERLLAALRMMNNQITGKRDGEIHLIDLDAVVYIESVDRRSFLYTADAVYESELRLYELEQRLEEAGFCRVSKSCLIHLKKIRSLRAEIDRKLRVTMTNGEQIIASRLYADELKKRLGVT